MRRLSTFRPYVRTLRPGGIPIKVPIVDLFSEDWYGEWLETSSELAWIRRELLRPGDIVADCGANIGFTSAFFAHCVGPTGHVHAFEPLPRNAAAVRRSVELNELANVTVVNAAVGSARGTVRLATGFGNAVIDAASGTLDVPVLTLDEHFADTRPDFLKIDVEGYELEVLRGARAILARRPKVALEIHCASLERPAEDIAAMLDLLDVSGGEAHIQLKVEGELVPFEPTVHTPELIARFHNVHVFVMPRATRRTA